jgi:alkaline phosphatase D
MLGRRDLLRTMVLGTVWITASAHARLPQARIRADVDPLLRFPQGLASADPTPDGVMLWTRLAARDAGRDEALHVQVSERPDFTALVAEERVTATAAADHSVRVTIDGLRPDRFYHYRFVTAEGTASQSGRTRTAPAPDTARAFRFATASCQNFQTGYYHAYRTLVERERRGEEPLDFILFLGDFIYELIFRAGVRPLTLPGRDWTGSDGVSGTHLDYQFAESLEDYRYLYRAYLGDPWLREARALWPFLSIWDDHEFTNDCWQSMATYPDAATPAQKRRMAASQAWFEYVPARLTGPLAHDFKPAAVADAPFGRAAGVDPASEPNNQAAIGAIALPRALRWGKLGDVILTDSRSYRSEPAVSPEAAKQVSLHPRALLPRALVETLDSGGRTMWSDRQLAWVKDRLRHSGAQWKLCTSSIPMMPLGFDFRFDPKTAKTLKEEVVFTIDSWDGYPAERRALLDFIAGEGIGNVAVFSGDHHMHFAGTLDAGPAGKRRAVATEFSVAGISSTSLGDVLKGFTAGAMHGTPAAALIAGPDKAPGPRWANLSFRYDMDEALRCLADLDAGRPVRPAPEARRLEHLRFIDVQSYGAAIVHVDAERLQVTYDNYTAAQLAAGYAGTQEPIGRISLSVASGSPVQAEGPTFEGAVPFPYSA